MLKWYLKYILSAILGMLPYRHKLHQIAQKIIGSHVLDEEEMLSRALELLSLSKKFKQDLDGLRLLEIGTGWFPYTPIIAYLLGAEKIVTVDINPWLKPDNLEKTIESIVRHSEKIRVSLGANEDQFNIRLNKLESLLATNDIALNCIEDMNIDYFPGMDVNDVRTNKDEKFDIVLSTNVLEHVEPKLLEKIYTTMSAISNHDGIMVHRFNPADHFAKLSGSTISFLTISDFVWNTFLGGRGISYHNRLRSTEHVSLQKTNGWSIKFWANAVDQRAVEGIKNGKIKVTPKYQDMEVEDVCAFYSWLVSVNSYDESVDDPKIVKWVTDIL